MIHFVTVIHIITCVLLVLVVLMQQGKKDGMGAAFGGGSQSVFGARGAETFLEKFTKVLAVIFMCTSLTLVYFSSKDSSSSILADEKTTTEAPVTSDKAAGTDGTPTTPPPAVDAKTDASALKPTTVPATQAPAAKK